MTASPPPVAIVTGAGSGIGRAVCNLLAQAQHRLVLVGRTETKLQETIAMLAEDVLAQSDTLIIPADLADAAQARGVIDLTIDRFGRIDVLINNAGFAPLVPIDETDEDLLYSVFAVNVFGPAHLIAASLPIMRRRKHGCIVNVSSVSASDPFPGLSAYGAAKSALDGYTRSIMIEAADDGITAYSVAPGAVETPMLRSIFSECDVPKERTLDPMDVARVIVECARGERPEDAGKVIQVVK